jgi:hypothetical protein
VEGYCERGNEPSGSIKQCEFPDEEMAITIQERLVPIDLVRETKLIYRLKLRCWPFRSSGGLVVGFPPRWPESGYVGFMVDKATLEQIFSEYFGFPCQVFHLQLVQYANSGFSNSGLG